jgi:predicted ATP-dependent endonuclease of OLD family
MSDFWSRYDDAMYDDYLDRLVGEEEMKILYLQQCIYLFVEGETEEEAYPELLAKCDLNIDDIGVVVADYNGAGNLIHCLRLLQMTLSHDRPVVVTIDNDEEGLRNLNKAKKYGFDMKHITILPMPSISPSIEYKSGHTGGAFEEMFYCDQFVDQAFCSEFMPGTIVTEKKKFLESLENTSGWFDQLMKFCALRGYTEIKDYKKQIGVRLAETCERIPPDISALADTLRRIRKEHPVRHPADIAWERIKRKRSNKRSR